MPNKPIPTVGHHFSDILICKQKAWLHYHGDSRLKMKPPARLRAMQVEGQHLEAQIYETRYAGAVKIPGIGTKSNIRSDKTIDAMRKGEPAILQGFVETSLGNGTIDVMERIGKDPGSTVGYSYRVGEIKRSEKLMTAHIMQVSWYTELLEQAFGQKTREAFFFLGGKDDQVHYENLENYRTDYQATKKALFELRDKEEGPGPHLMPACQTCDWRGLCMPQLLTENHPSLLPDLTQNHVMVLKSMGVKQWQDLDTVSDGALTDLGFNTFSIALIRKGRENLGNSYAVLRNNFRAELFDDAAYVSLEFEELRARHRQEDDGHLRPIRIHWTDGENIHSEEIRYDIQGNSQVDLMSLSRKSMLVLYGGADLGAFARIYRQNCQGIMPRLFDLLRFIETHVHVPFVGLELPYVLKHITHKEEKTEGAQRVAAIRVTAEWIARSL